MQMMKKTLEQPNIIIIIVKFVFNDGKKLDPQVFLDAYLYKLAG